MPRRYMAIRRRTADHRHPETPNDARKELRRASLGRIRTAPAFVMKGDPVPGNRWGFPVDRPALHTAPGSASRYLFCTARCPGYKALLTWPAPMPTLGLQIRFSLIQG